MAEYHPDIQYLTTAQAASDLKIHQSTLRNAIREGRLPCVRLYGRILIAPDDLDAYKQRTRPDGVKPTHRPPRSPGAPE